MKFCLLPVILLGASIAFIRSTTADIIKIDEDLFIESVGTDVTGLVKYEHIYNATFNDTKSPEGKRNWASFAFDVQNLIQFYTSSDPLIDYQRCLFNMKVHARTGDNFVHYGYGKCNCGYTMGSDVNIVQQASAVGGLFSELEKFNDKYNQWQDNVLETNVDSTKYIIGGTVHCGSEGLIVVARRLNNWKKGVQVTKLKLISQEKKWYAKESSHGD